MPNPQPNWGKSYAADRGEVEYVRVALPPVPLALVSAQPSPRDFTVYLCDPQGMFGVWNDRPFNITFGNGGTASLVQPTASIRGTALHFGCSELLVRGDTSSTEAVPATAGFRYQAHAALGRPTEHVYSEIAFRSDAPGLVLDFPLQPYSTAAWFEAYPAANITDTVVQQIYRHLGADTEVWGAQPPGPDDFLPEWLEPHYLDPRTNILRVTIGAGAVFPGIYFQLNQRIVQ